MKFGKVYNEDCFNVLKTLPENSIDFVLTDPPYGDTDNKGKIIKTGNLHSNFNIEWNNIFPIKFIKYLYRIMKPDTWGCIFCDKNYISFLWKELENNNFKPRNTFYWIKTNKAPTPRSNFKSGVETAVVFTKGRTTIKWRGGANQNNFINLPLFSKKFLGKSHPTMKHPKLFEHLISLFTDERDVVLDCFAGSGTTAVACINLNRKYILIEKNKEYYNLILDRIKIEKGLKNDIRKRKPIL